MLIYALKGFNEIHKHNFILHLNYRLLTMIVSQTSILLENDPTKQAAVDGDGYADESATSWFERELSDGNSWREATLQMAQKNRSLESSSKIAPFFHPQALLLDVLVFAKSFFPEKKANLFSPNTA